MGTLHNGKIQMVLHSEDDSAFKVYVLVASDTFSIMDEELSQKFEPLPLLSLSYHTL